jgi:hypothetical protein
MTLVRSNLGTEIEGACTPHYSDDKPFTILEETIGRHGSRWKNNIKTDLQELRYKGTG